MSDRHNQRFPYDETDSLDIGTIALALWPKPDVRSAHFRHTPPYRLMDLCSR